MTAYDGVTYTWDAEGEPVSSSAPATMYYDPFGRVAEKYSSSTSTVFDYLYGPGGVVLGITPGNSSTANASVAVALPGGAFARYWKLASTQGGPNSRYLHSDWLGTTRLITDTGTGVYSVTTGAFSPFGQSYAGNVSNFFTGAGNNDAIAGWTFPARDQLPDEGRWFSSDPAGRAAMDPTNPQTWNRYAYVMNKPLNTTGPMGLSTIYGFGACALGETDFYVNGQYDSSAINLYGQCYDSPGSAYLPGAGSIGSTPKPAPKPPTPTKPPATPPIKTTVVCTSEGCIIPGGPPTPCSAFKTAGLLLNSGGAIGRLIAFATGPDGTVVASGIGALGAVLTLAGNFHYGCAP